MRPAPLFGLVVVLVAALAVSVGARADERELTVLSGEVVLKAWVVGPDSAGGTLVVLHGGPGLDHAHLLPLAWLASDERRVVFYDQRGAGSSSRPPSGDYTLAAEVADLDAVRRAAGAERVHLVAHSFGTVLALA